MQLRRIEIRDFRKIQHRIVEDLDGGLNVLVGDNEAGKSTLLAALRAAFFEKHSASGSSIEDMLPYGSSVRPEVEVDFSIDGQDWRLRKAFNQRKEAELVGPGTRLTGTAVEDRLADLLGFVPPARGGSEPAKHQGTHGLLWVAQGTSEALRIGAGRETLAGALEREVGQVTGGDRGRALLAAAAERHDTLWTKQGKPRGRWRELQEEIDRLDGEAAALRVKQQATETRIARLGEVTDILARHTRDDRLGRAMAAVTAARSAVTNLTSLSEAHESAARRRLDSERDSMAARERVDRRTVQVTEAEKAQADIDRSARLAREAETVVRHREGQVLSVEAALRRARDAQSVAATRTRAIETALRRREAQTQLARQDEQWRQASALDDARRAAQLRAEAVTIDKEGMSRLVALERAAEATRAESRASGVELRFEPDGARQIRVGDESHATDLPLRLARDTVLTLEGFGKIAIRPGGGAAALARKAEEAEHALAEALRKVGFPTVGAAREALETKAQAVTEAASLTRSLAALAPKGLDALRQAIEAQRARLAQAPGADAPEGETADEIALQAARAAEATAQTAFDEASRQDRVATEEREKARLEAARLAEREGGARQHGEGLQAQLGRARLDADDALLAKRVADAEAVLAQASVAEQQAASALEAADPESTRLTLQRAERAEQEIRADVQRLDRERLEIQAELRGGGFDGVSERLAEIEGVLTTRGRELAALDTEAAAARLLYEALKDAQREAKDRWLAPVRARVAPYLKLLAPGSEIEVDEHSLELRTISRNGVTEPFEALSMGAREQIAVVTRLALADVLRAAGHPAVVILDDALVNTDEVRLQRMHNVLTRAASGLQILILTCRERDFLGLGKIHRI